MFTKEESRLKIQELTENFADKLDFIKTSGQYKEAQIEDEFIKPLFRYLNWNISNEGIKNPAEREFIVQAQGKNGKEPDYLLQLDKNPLFYIEAKHSKYDLQKRTDYIWQAYSYSYSTQSKAKFQKVDFALLTDFEEFRFFDCTFPVKNHQTLNNYCVIDWKYQDYIQNFDRLWEYFERENVRNGSLQSLYINEKKIKENRIPPDKAFLKDLDDEKDGWRIKLAKDIKKYQPDFSAEFITQSVQLILDRFIFIKVLSDRDIDEDIIKNLVNKISSIKDKEEGIIYEECRDVFDSLDKTYNGSIFTKRSELDSVKVSNKILLEILKDLLPENSRYNFKVIPIEILGTIYEQFLGKVVVTTDKRASIDYKPEVRKAGGVYYTPDYIVDYIVEKTVGEKLKECKKFEDLLEIKICDPACGSGSFLITAYDHLIRWTISYYESKIKTDTTANSSSSELKGISKDERKLVYLDSDGQVRLTSKIKRDILKSCIYGVDIDAQAVEVTKMSLSLKALENTNHYEVYNERTLFHTTILPTLEGNIKCGNSLVDFDIKTDQKMLLSDNSGHDYEKEINRLNPFNWKSEFKNIFLNDGFDCVIGNPPYISVEGFDKTQGDYFLRKFKSAIGRVNTFSLFIEQSLSMLKNNGLLGEIVSNRLLTNTQMGILREYILKNVSLKEVVSFEKMVFKDASVDTVILLFSKLFTKVNNISIRRNRSRISIKNKEDSNVLATTWLKNPNSIFNLEQDESLSEILQKIESISINLNEICDVKDGIILGSIKDLFLSDNKKDERYKKFLDGNCVSKYNIDWDGKWICYDSDLNKKELDNKKKSFKALKNDNHEFKRKSQSGVRLREKYIFEQTKIITRQNAKRIIGTLDEENYYVKNSLHNILLKDKNYDLKFILGILNSKLMDFYFQNKIGKTGELFSQMKVEYVKQLPIFNLTKTDENISKEIISLVSILLELNRKLKSQKLQVDSNNIKREIEYSENKIDQLVYILYDLTPDEIAIVEGAV